MNNNIKKTPYTPGVVLQLQLENFKILKFTLRHNICENLVSLSKDHKIKTPTFYFMCLNFKY